MNSDNYGDAIAALLAGAPAREVERLVARGLGGVRGGQWLAVAVAPGRADRSAADRDAFVSVVAEGARTPFVHLSGGVAVAFVPDVEDPIKLCAGLERSGAVVALSDSRPWAELSSAAAQARARLAAARIAGGADRARVLAGVVDPEAARWFAMSLFGDLVRSRPRDATELLRSLRVWLSHHGSWDPAAAELGVHRNTVRHRIGLVARQLEVDVNRAEVRAELWFALSWWG